MKIRQKKDKAKEKEKKRDDWVDEYRGSLGNKAIRQYFRGFSTRGIHKLVRSVERIRQRVSPARYSDAMEALLLTGSAHFNELFPLGQRRFGDLGRFGDPFEPLPLESELRWTAQWLSVRASHLSNFRTTARELSELVGQQSYAEALEMLEAYRTRVGYSFWQVELHIALKQLSSDSAETKDLVSKLRKQCPPNSVSSFIAFLMGERNDESLSYDAFYARCKENIPRMHMDEWLKSYMLYRGLQHYELTAAALGQNLRNERRSSLIDLYETFVETCVTICTSREFQRYRADVLDAISVLDDIDDPRLLKIQLYAGGGWSPDLKCADREVSAWSDLHPFLLYRGAGSEQTPIPAARSQIHADLAEVWDKGSGAGKAVARLLKYGVNLKSLDIGIAIASHAERQSSKTGPLMLIASGTPFCFEGVSLEEVYGSPVDLSHDLLKEYVSRQKVGTEGAAALAVIAGSSDDLGVLSHLGKLWIANLSFSEGRYAMAREAASQLRCSGPRWVREATKHQYVSAYSRGDLRTACAVLTNALIEDPALSIELPISEMFMGRKWRDFANLDLVQVGIAAHYAVDAPASSPVGFILSRACRELQLQGFRARIEGEPDLAMPPQQLKQMVLFFSEVWDENVLTRTGAFETTHDVRVERLQVVRRLLDWDKGNEDDYKAVIKALTLDETLWLGVKHVNETRVFVNEPAITRWAEKELIEEFNRWREMMNIDVPSEEVTEAKVLEYLSVESVAGVVPLERPTEADALFVSIVNRLLTRFLTDPTDGLNCYLSVRVRHGSLLRALYGPSDAIDLLLSTGDDDAEQLRAVSTMCGVDGSPVEEVRALLLEFSSEFRALGKRLIEDRIQLSSEQHPDGLFRPELNYSGVLEGLVRTAKLGNFSFFVEACYFVFWSSLSGSLESARQYMIDIVKVQVADLFATLQHKLKLVLPSSPQFHAQVAQAATLSTAACDQTANWFKLPNMLNVLTFKLSDAVEVARRISQTLNPGFDPRIDAEFPVDDLPLAGIGLSSVVDCLLVIFDNVRVHADTGAHPMIRIVLSVEDDVLWLKSANALSTAAHLNLRNGRLAEVEARLGNGDSSELAAEEGGSGLAKMKRLTKSVARGKDRPPFTFGLLDDPCEWFVMLGMKLHKSQGDSYYVY